MKFLCFNSQGKGKVKVTGQYKRPLIVEKLPYPQRVTVQCGLWSGGVIRPYFFENEAGGTVTVNRLRYREMINDFFMAEIGQYLFIWTTLTFNKTALRATQATKPLIFCREKFPGRVISRRGDHNWPPRSSDLTPCDFLLQGHVKEKIYANSPASIQDLKDVIREAIQAIGQPLCDFIVENFIIRIWSCKRGRGGSTINGIQLLLHNEMNISLNIE